MSEQLKSGDQNGDYTPFSEKIRKRPAIRHLAELRPEEHEAYLAIPG